MTQDIGIEELQKLIIKNASEFGYMGTTLSQQSMKLIELEEKIDLLQKMIEEKNNEIKDLEKIHNSKIWKVLKKLDKSR